MMTFKQRLKATPVRKLYFLPHRFKMASSYYARQIGMVTQWLALSNECSNFTYDLTSLNSEYLASFLAVITGAEVEQVKSYFSEIINDQQLKQHIRKITEEGDERYISDLEAKYGRRMGWYALVRILKPKVVIETGIDKGLGACVIAAALMKNASESAPGKYYGTDILPQAGALFKSPYSEMGEILYGDSIESLKKFSDPIDLFINDSDHSADYEEREYEVIASKLSPRGVIVGDNAHVTDCLFKFAKKTGKNFLYFQEKPEAHWYPGAGLGVAFSKVK